MEKNDKQQPSGKVSIKSFHTQQNNDRFSFNSEMPHVNLKLNIRNNIYRFLLLKKDHL